MDDSLSGKWLYFGLCCSAVFSTTSLYTSTHIHHVPTHIHPQLQFHYVHTDYAAEGEESFWKIPNVPEKEKLENVPEGFRTRDPMIRKGAIFH